MAPKTHFRSRRPKIYQDSPFLDLPGEIRILIYRAALKKPSPIDLWSKKVIKSPEDVPDLKPRLEKLKKENPGVSSPPHFRDQYDLKYVRKEMAVGLLGTCRQVFCEAAHIFWSENIFKFGDDADWAGIRRFLMSIGPRARSMISRIEVFPILCPWMEFKEDEGCGWPFWFGYLAVELHATGKNHPKMHMVKLPYATETTSSEITEGKNAQLVLELLRTEQTLKELTMVWPGGHDLHLDQSRTSLEFYETVRAKLPFKISLVIESNSALKGTNVRDWLMENDISLICEAGSSVDARIKTQDDQPDPERIIQLTQWNPPPRKVNVFVGLDELFDTEPKLSIHSRGGKSSSVKYRKSTARVLKGFGGCRFVTKKVLCCWTCGFESNEPPKDEWFGFCTRCGRYEYFQSQPAVRIRKRMRAERLGVIERVIDNVDD
jgi:hypothetical protein